MSQESRLIKIKEVSQLLGLKIDQIKNLIKDGKLPVAIKPSRRFSKHIEMLFDRKKIEAIAKQREEDKQPLSKRICGICNQEFTPDRYSYWQSFCSKECGHAYGKKTLENLIIKD